MQLVNPDLAGNPSWHRLRGSSTWVWFLNCYLLQTHRSGLVLFPHLQSEGSSQPSGLWVTSETFSVIWYCDLRHRWLSNLNWFLFPVRSYLNIWCPTFPIHKSTEHSCFLYNDCEIMSYKEHFLLLPCPIFSIIKKETQRKKPRAHKC